MIARPPARLLRALTAPLLLVAFGLLVAMGLAGCTSSLGFHVQSSDPSGVASVYVIVGNEAELPDTTDQDEVSKLVVPSRYERYFAFAEFAVDREGGTGWRELNRVQKDPKKVQFDHDDAGVIQVTLDLGVLEAMPDTCLVVVTGNRQGDFRMKRWTADEFEGVEGVIKIDVTADGIAEVL